MSGTTLRGLIRLNDTMLLGPDPLGSFIPIAVKSIHRKRMPVKEVRGGQTASFALKKVGGSKMSHSNINGEVWKFFYQCVMMNSLTGLHVGCGYFVSFIFLSCLAYHREITSQQCLKTNISLFLCLGPLLSVPSSHCSV